MKKAIAGPLAGQPLVDLPSARIKWKTWKRKHPDTLVLSDKTGYNRDYASNPYEGYYRIGRLMFPVGNVRKDFPAKERVLGVAVGSFAKAYELAEIIKYPGILKDRIDDTIIHIHVSNDGEVTGVKDSNGNDLPHIFSYWFAWQAFHPETEVFTSP